MSASRMLSDITDMVTPSFVSSVHLTTLQGLCVKWAARHLHELLMTMNSKPSLIVSARPTSPCVFHFRGWFYHRPSLWWPGTSFLSFPLLDLLYSAWTPCLVPCTSLPLDSFFTLYLTASAVTQTDPCLPMPGLLQQTSCLSTPAFSLFLYFPARLGYLKCESDLHYSFTYIACMTSHCL